MQYISSKTSKKLNVLNSNSKHLRTLIKVNVFLVSASYEDSHSPSIKILKPFSNDRQDL